MRLGTDSSDYYVLQNAAESIKNVPGMVMEIGVREGGGLQYIIDGLTNVHDNGRTVIGLDPYGDLPYEWKDGKIASWTYSNMMRSKAHADLYTYVKDKPINLHLLTMTDVDFFTYFEDGFPVFENGVRSLENKFALVHFDGPHNLQHLLNTCAVLAPRTSLGGIWVFDDVEDFYDHNSLEKAIKDYYALIEKTHKKASYRRLK